MILSATRANTFLNERHIHHRFSYSFQKKYSHSLALGHIEKGMLHPEWPTIKKVRAQNYGGYKKNAQKEYVPSLRGAGFIDFAIGDYESPDIGIEFSLKQSWSREEVTFDFLKLLDKRNPFKIAISLNIVLRISEGGREARFIRAMNDAFKDAKARLEKNQLLSDHRNIHFIIAEVDAKDCRIWHLDDNSGRFVEGDPFP